MYEDYIEIDGSLFEGGGQMIRSSLALATILGKGFRMHSIRKNRPNPGINNQLKNVFSAFTTKTLNVGEQEIYIYPNFLEPKHIKSQSAASCTLMLQCFVPVFAALGYQGSVKMEGGTDVSKSPCQESIQLGLIPLMKKMGVELIIEDIKRGYYPKGFGYIIFKVKAGETIKPINFTNFTPPNKVVITYYLKSGELPNSSKQLVRDIKAILKETFPDDKIEVDAKPFKVSCTKKDQYGIGCMVLGDGLIWDVGTVGEVTEENKILERLTEYCEKKVCLDEHHQDQLLLLSALAEGTSKLFIGNELSLHTESLLYVMKCFIPELKYSHKEGILEIEGIGYKCQHTQKKEEAKDSDSDQ